MNFFRTHTKGDMYNVDYIVFYFSWDSSAGIDLDTGVEFIDSNISGVDYLPLGYGLNTNITISGNKILEWGGDQTQSGDETFCIYVNNLKTYSSILPSITNIILRNHWYSSVSAGKINVTIRGFSGGTMSLSGYTFINTGGSLKYTSNFQKIISTHLAYPTIKSWRSLMTYMGKIQYNKDLDIASFDYSSPYITTEINYTTTTTYTVPAGITKLFVECIGAGGAGGGVTGTNSAGGGGSGGGYVQKVITVTPGSIHTVTVGIGGVGTTGNGGNGGDSWFSTNTTILAKGGLGALGVSIDNFGSEGAIPNTGNIGDFVYEGVSGTKGVGGSSAGYGGGGGKSYSRLYPTEEYTSAPGNASNGTNASPSSNTGGSAGSGACSIGVSTNYSGGNGARGLVRISYFT